LDGSFSGKNAGFQLAYDHPEVPMCRFMNGKIRRFSRECT
jgi:hypothetical protein